jgi:[ribosomal protein S5]-alanine N-acetyltransferase
MRSIRLIGINYALKESLKHEPGHFEALYRGKLGAVADLVRRVVEQTLADVPDGGDESLWGGYLAVDESSQAVIGTCAFKAPPAEDATVEVAYFTFPPFEGRGYATAMASKLIGVAEGSTEVKRIIARTLPETSASTRVLEKVGMEFVGEVFDPEDGRVWEWQVGRRA